MAPPLDVDLEDVAAAGWAIVFPSDVAPAVRAALAPLILHRHAMAGAAAAHSVRELDYRPGESRAGWAARHGAPAGVFPSNFPFYLTLVGGPESIPFEFQVQLSVSFAVGRISFDTPESYDGKSSV